MEKHKQDSEVKMTIRFEENVIPSRNLSGITLLKTFPITMPIIIAKVREFKFIEVHNSHLQVKYAARAKTAQNPMPKIFFFIQKPHSFILVKEIIT